MDGVLRPTRSQGGTPILGLEEIALPKWKSGPLTPVQGLFPNSTAMTLLVCFAQDNVQLQGNAIKHLQEGNLARLQQVTVELLEPETGRVMGSIPDVNFVEGMEQMPIEQSIGETLRELELEVVEQTNETIFKNGTYSMGKQKRGKENPTPSPTMKAEQKRHSEEEKEKEEKKKLKRRNQLQDPVWGLEKGSQLPDQQGDRLQQKGQPIFHQKEHHCSPIQE